MGQVVSESLTTEDSVCKAANNTVLMLQSLARSSSAQPFRTDTQVGEFKYSDPLFDLLVPWNIIVMSVFKGASTILRGFCRGPTH
jgi:hypothetical protein